MLGGRGLGKPCAGRRGLGGPCAWGAGPQQAKCQVGKVSAGPARGGGASASHVPGRQGLGRPRAREEKPRQALCRGRGGASAGRARGGGASTGRARGERGLGRLYDWGSRLLQGEPGRRGLGRPFPGGAWSRQAARGEAGPRLALCPGGGASAGRGRRGHTAHTQSQAQPSSQSAAILNRGVALISSGTVF